ncbi:hypothetical protein ACQP0C_23525 [Nocardia sp. CA-129566]|uniref:hypothetical protein n=1 Tax=Nocardia sp. CA-129566 TaxID=3239976 RepID=UPI003D96D267
MADNRIGQRLYYTHYRPCPTCGRPGEDVAGTLKQISADGLHEVCTCEYERAAQITTPVKVWTEGKDAEEWFPRVSCRQP